MSAEPSPPTISRKLLRIIWGVTVAAMVFAFVLIGSASDLTGTGTSPQDGFGQVAMLLAVAMFVMAIFLGYFTFTEQRRARFVGWWVATAAMSVAAGFVLALPFLHPSKQWEPGGAEGAGILATVSVHAQLRSLGGAILVVGGFAILGAVIGFALALVVGIWTRPYGRSTRSSGDGDAPTAPAAA